MSKRSDNYKKYDTLGQDQSYQPDDQIITIEDQETFDKFLRLTNQAVCVLDVYAKWCQPCKALAPAYFELSKMYKEKGIYLMKMDGENPVFSESDLRQHITAFPTFLIFKNGQIVKKLVGGPISKIDEMLSVLV